MDLSIDLHAVLFARSRKSRSVRCQSQTVNVVSMPRVHFQTLSANCVPPSDHRVISATQKFAIPASCQVPDTVCVTFEFMHTGAIPLPDNYTFVGTTCGKVHKVEYEFSLFDIIIGFIGLE